MKTGPVAASPRRSGRDGRRHPQLLPRLLTRAAWKSSSSSSSSSSPGGAAETEDEKRRLGREEKSTTLSHTPSPANACERASPEDGSWCGKPSGVLRGHCELAPQVVDLAHSRSTPTRLTLSVSTSRRTAVHRNSPRHGGPSSPQPRGSDEVLRCPPWAENTSLRAVESREVLRCPPWARRGAPPNLNRSNECAQSTIDTSNMNARAAC